MHFRSKICTRLIFRTLSKKTPLIGNKPILTKLLLNKSRYHQRRRRRLPVTAKKERFKAMMHPGRLRGQERKKLRCVKVDLPFLKTASMVTRGSKLAFGLRFCRTSRAKHSSTDVERSEGGSKKHKSTGSSSFNTESEEASINLNTNVGDNDEDEVQETQRPRGMDKAKDAGKKKRSKSSASASSNVNDDALARLMVTEMTAQEKQERLAFLDIKRREVECREQEIEQQDMRLYLQPYDHLTGDQLKAMDVVRARINAK
nr:hypothetical protein [Tanacetum cinerariifolium]